MDEKSITLESIGGGALIEQFENCLKDVVSNLMDVNIDRTPKREINIKIVFKLNDDRSAADIEFNVVPKLAGAPGIRTLGFFGKEGGAFKIVEYNPKQGLLFENKGHVKELKKDG